MNRVSSNDTPVAKIASARIAFGLSAGNRKTRNAATSGSRIAIVSKSSIELDAHPESEIPLLLESLGYGFVNIHPVFPRVVFVPYRECVENLLGSPHKPLQKRKSERLFILRH